MILSILVIYVFLTIVAAYLLSDGFAVNCPMSVLGLFAAMWPFLLILVAIAYYEEWRYRLRNGV